MTLRTFSNIPPTLVPGSPWISTRGDTEATPCMIASAPSSTLTSVLRCWPVSVIVPAGIRRSWMSPFGVLMTTALRVPVRARATGTMVLVSSGSRSKRVAMS